MMFITKLTYYCLMFFTCLVALNNMYQGFIHWNSGHNPFYIKQCYALASLPSVYLIFLAYKKGECNEAYTSGIGSIIIAWTPWLIVTLAYLALAKYQGRM